MKPSSVWCLSIVFALFANLPGQLAAQSPATVFRGLPSMKISEGGVERSPEAVPRTAAVNLTCAVSKIGDDYYWASREKTPLVAIDSGGAYVTYVAVNGSGYIRVLKPEFKKAASLVDDTDRAYDYIEHLLVGLRTVTYYGVKQ
jgi:hypothetical protein